MVWCAARVPAAGMKRTRGEPGWRKEMEDGLGRQVLGTASLSG